MSNYVTGATKIIVKSTGENKTAIYCHNRKGNMQFNIDGKFYNDTKFSKLFKVKKNG